MSIAFSPISGPDCGRTHRVEQPAVVGRATSAHIRHADEALGVHHFIVLPSGEVTSLAATLIDIGDDEHLIRAGNSRFHLTAAAAPQHRRSGPIVVRPPRRPEREQPADELVSPDTRARHGGSLIVGLITVAASAVVAVITGSWMMLAFGLVGVIGTVAHIGVESVRTRRDQRRVRQQRRERRLAEHRAQRQYWPIDLGERVASNSLWSQRHDDPIDVVVGISDLEGLPGAPVRIDLGAQRVIAVRAGTHVAHAVLRSLVAQAIVASGPADLDVVVDDELHAVLPGIDDRVNNSTDDRRLLIVTSSAPSLIHADGALRRLLDANRSTSCLCLLGVGDEVPAVCTDIIDVGADWSAVIDGRDGVIAIEAVGTTGDTWEHTMTALSGLIDPEDLAQAARRIPTHAVFSEPAPGVADLRSAVAVLGEGADGPVSLDLVADGPHALIAGTTGSGKSELLCTMVTSLCLRHDPDTVTFLLIDHKGGAAFDRVADLPHVLGVVTDLEGTLVDRVLVSLDAEVRRREVMLRVAGVADVAALEPGGGTPPRLIIMVDEFASLASAAPHALTGLVDIARRGRSLGMHLVLATQRPAGVIDEAVRSNTNIRIALRLQDRADALDVIGDDRAARLDRRVPGRALIRIGGDEPIEFQTAMTTNVPVAECVAHMHAREVRPPHRPWTDPLPSVVTSGIGVVDVCDEQRHESLEWHPDEGNLSIIGAVGSGTTTALITLAQALDGVGIYVLDGRGDGRLTSMSTCGLTAPVVALRDRERVDRLVRTIAIEVETRQSLGAVGTPLVLMIDGIAETIRSLDEPGRRALDDLERILDEGPAVGVVTVTAGGEVRRDLRQAITWRMDTGAHRSTAGRIRIEGGRRHGLEAQIAIVAAEPSAHRPVPPAIEVLSVMLDAAAIRGRRDGQGTVLTLGQAAADLDDARIELPDGEHLLVIGPARSGRSTTLAVIAHAWSAANHGLVTVVERTGSLATIPHADGPHLVIVDDAALIDDVDGSFTARLEGREPGLCVVAAVHADAVRSRFGHWTSVIRRSRRGVVMSAAGEGDGDLIGASIPIRPAMPPRPGLGWICADGTVALAQLATGDPVPSTAMLER